MDRPPDLDLLAVVSVDDIEREAPRYVAASAWNYFASGAETESTLRANVASFGTYLLVPRMLVPGSSRPDLGVTLPLGRRLASPVLVAPSAMHRLAHPDGELASARAAASRGAGYCLSTLSTTPLEEVAAAAKPGCPLLLLQVYILKDREATAGLVRRAARCGSRFGSLRGRAAPAPTPHQRAGSAGDRADGTDAPARTRSCQAQRGNRPSAAAAAGSA